MDKIMENNFFFSFNVHQCNFADNVAFIFIFFLGGGVGSFLPARGANVWFARKEINKCPPNTNNYNYKEDSKNI